MKKLVLAVMFCFSLGCINVVHADFLGIGRFWEDVKRETTNALKNVRFSINSNYEKEFNGEGNLETKVEINL